MCVLYLKICFLFEILEFPSVLVTGRKIYSDKSPMGCLLTFPGRTVFFHMI